MVLLRQHIAAWCSVAAVKDALVGYEMAQRMTTHVCIAQFVLKSPSRANVTHDDTDVDETRRWPLWKNTM